MKKFAFICLACSMLALTACNKTKQTSKRLMKAGEWKVQELTVNGTAQEALPTWIISDCDIYDELCVGVWSGGSNAQTDFIWQFTNKGKDFEISRQDGNTAQTPEAIAVAQQCYDLSGVYEVTDSDKTGMRFVSTTTLGYPGDEVVIAIANL